MADIKISELGSAASVNDTDAIPMTASGVTVKVTAALLKNYMGVGALSDLATDDKTSLVNAVNEVDSHTDIVQAQVSGSDDTYNTSKAYVADELCIYNNVLYRCTTACSAGSWATNQSCFTQDTLVNVVGKQLKIKAIPFTGTTDANGFVSLGLGETTKVISILISNYADYFVLPYVQTNHIYSCRILNYDLTSALPNTAVSGLVFILDN